MAGIEVLIAADQDCGHLVALAGSDQVIDVRLIVDDVLLFELHVGVEIARGLEIVPQIVRAFNQQVVIHGVFLVNRNVLP